MAVLGIDVARLNGAGLAYPKEIVKRDGRVVPFEADRIEGALRKCLGGLGRGDESGLIEGLTLQVVYSLTATLGASSPTVERVQDLVEIALHASGEFEAAKRYILYRHEHAKERAARPIPDEVRRAFAEDAQFFPTELQRLQFYDKYARFSYEAGRRETYVEAVDRVVAQYARLVRGYGALPEGTLDRVRGSILGMRAMPSMRMLSMAGPAFERDNATQYNCTYLPMDGPEAWCEAMWLSMAGCGVGFSVERTYVERFPRVQRQRGGRPRLLVVEDSSEGWCEALRTGVEMWLAGEDVAFDFGLIRKRGAILRIKGGRASGPEPLERLLAFTRQRILGRQGSTLRTTDVHDIACAVGSAAVSGGVRRTAMISIFDADDANMAAAKSGDFERDNAQRWNANNSAVWDGLERLTQEQFIDQFMEMVRSGRGEPGIFNREAARTLSPSRRQRNVAFGINPCGEIILRPHGMCNLTTVVARSHDTLESLQDKVTQASVMGTIQSLGTYFPYLRPVWKRNAEDERLLGVSIGGQLDCPLLTGKQGSWVLHQLRETAVRVNHETARALGVSPSAAVTCVKPDGNSSQLLDMSSGIHARWAPYYVRTVRLSGTSALAKVMKDAGAPMEPENGDDPANPHTWVVSFPVKAPEGAVTRNDRSAVEQCRYWLMNKLNWTEHNPSVTITYTPGEVLDLMRWVWEHRHQVGGMAFLPSSDAKYAQLPYQEIDREEYERRKLAFPVIDFAKVYRYEYEDWTTAAQQVACLTGVCEVDG